MNAWLGALEQTEMRAGNDSMEKWFVIVSNTENDSFYNAAAGNW